MIQFSKPYKLPEPTELCLESFSPIVCYDTGYIKLVKNDPPKKMDYVDTTECCLEVDK